MATLTRDKLKDIVKRSKGKSPQEIFDAIKRSGVTLDLGGTKVNTSKTGQKVNDPMGAQAKTTTGLDVGQGIDRPIGNLGDTQKTQGERKSGDAPLPQTGTVKTQQQFSPTQNKRNVDMLKTMYQNRIGRFGEEKAKELTEKAAKRLGIDTQKIFGDTQPAITDVSSLTADNVETNLDSVFGKASGLQSDIQSEQDAIDFITSESKVLADINNSFAEQIKQQIDELKALTSEANKNIADTSEKRIQLAKDTFQTVRDELDELSQLGKSVFDQNVAKARQARARELAEAGILTDEQAAQAAQYSLSDYVRDAELRKTEIEQDIQQEIINAVKERDALIDQVYQQQNIDENTKQQQAAQIAGLYNTILQNQGNALQEIRARFSDQVLEMFQPTIAREQQLLTPEIQSRVSEQEVQQANRSPAARSQFILRKTNELVDQNLAPYIAEYLSALQASGTLMNRDLMELWGDLVARARQAFLADNQ